MEALNRYGVSLFATPPHPFFLCGSRSLWVEGVSLWIFLFPFLSSHSILSILKVHVELRLD